MTLRISSGSSRHTGSLLTFFTVILLAGIGACSRASNAPQGMAFIPAGEFLMGSDEIDTEGKGTEFGFVKPMYLDEHPLHKVHLKAYFIDINAVTNAQYRQFLLQTGINAPKNWKTGDVPPGRDDYPVTALDWGEADRYCRWRGARLPTEAEWEKAARGTDGRRYPWGNDFDPKRANTGDTGIGDLTPVGRFEEGKSPYGIHDMAGNVWQWTADWYAPYPGSDFTSRDYGQQFKVLRGGSWGGIGHYAIPYFYRTSHRFYTDPRESFSDIGFRCAKDAR